jgi:hypothetical protein
MSKVLGSGSRASGMIPKKHAARPSSTRRIDAVVDAELWFLLRFEPVNLTTRLHLALPGQYCIEVLTGSFPGPTVMVRDGETLWEAYADRTFRWSAAPPPARFAPLLDPAELLAGYRLTRLGPATMARRTGYRMLAKPDTEGGTQGHGVISRISYPADKIDVVIDTELGIPLRTAGSLAVLRAAG